ncbi:hypothetical protein AA11826_0360 [Komagataeibacter oboediens DSM 11826]|nr:hypothetical protein AA11826_0360 [Komagataeibacter oboediens DSM 11826]
MCGSDELIHDARQITLEEMIMTNETPMYLVPGRLTDEQRDKIVSIIVDCSDPKTDLIGSELQAFRDMADRVVAAILSGYGPIQPCADVETVGFVPDKSNLFVDKRLPMTNIYRSAGDPWPVPLVRRTDMEAQVARVAAEKDAEIDDIKALLRPVLTKLDYAAHELEQTEDAQSVHQLAHICLSLLSDEESIRQSALAELTALNEGAAG